MAEEDPSEDDNSEHETWADPFEIFAGINAGGFQEEGLTRSERKALDRETPWREIQVMTQRACHGFVETAKAESDSREKWAH